MFAVAIQQLLPAAWAGCTVKSFFDVYVAGS